jgi:hypothetical protein
LECAAVARRWCGVSNILMKSSRNPLLVAIAEMTVCGRQFLTSETALKDFSAAAGLVEVVEQPPRFTCCAGTWQTCDRSCFKRILAAPTQAHAATAVTDTTFVSFWLEASTLFWRFFARQHLKLGPATY